MTHDEYRDRLEAFTDSPEDARAVLEHAASCALCLRDERASNRALARLETRRDSRSEEIARWSAAAAILALVVLGFQTRGSDSTRSAAAPAGAVRYRIVGDATGVIAYTPEGVIVGVPPSPRSAEKETFK